MTDKILTLTSEMSDLRSKWKTLSLYERFEQTVVSLLTLVIAIIIALAAWQLLLHTIRLVESHVVDPASIAAPRRRRRAKTDKIDGEALLRALLASLPATWSVRLLPDHQPQIEVETMVSLPITVTTLVTELASFLLLLSPYLDLLDQMGVTAVADRPDALARAS